VDRFDFTKTFHDDLDAIGTGMMLSCGNPEEGGAGYVAIEIVHGHLGGRPGGFAPGPLGTVHEGSPTPNYMIVPGSGQGDFTGITGTLHLTIEDDVTHRYEQDYEI